VAFVLLTVVVLDGEPGMYMIAVSLPYSYATLGAKIFM
jgi:hypothetical protein